MISNYITIYLVLGLVISMLIDQAYLNKKNGHPDFIGLQGSYDWHKRAMTILLWPIILSIAVWFLIKHKRKNDGT